MNIDDPGRCYVCGNKEHLDTTSLGGHAFWSNADARKQFATTDALLSRPGYPEARYVAEHRPY